MGSAVAAAILAVCCIAFPAAAAAKDDTVWLCKPGIADNPCKPGLATTQVSPTGEVLGTSEPKAKKPKVDCFYVYPTVSDDQSRNSDLSIDPEERSIALYQAARYSQRCRVFAPMYEQITLQALFSGEPVTEQESALAYGDVVSAWKTYLRKYNKGRGVVLIGHSQGSYVLRALIAAEIDPRPAMRAKLISALLLGGDVTVRRGQDVGGDFKHIRACHSTTQLGCVVAFSTFDAPVPANSLFGRTTSRGRQVLCTNPAALGGGSAAVDSIFPTQPFAPSNPLSIGIKLLGLTLPTAPTTWIDVPGSYRARCSSAGGASVLQVTPLNGGQTPKASPDPTWGLHLMDANIALGNLVQLVRVQGAAYARRHPGA